MEIKFGKIVFQTANVGSKSESEQPFLVEGDGTMTQVFLEGDNPFMNTTLRAFEEKDVAISGAKKEGSVIFTITEIKENPAEENTATKSIEENEVPSKDDKDSENPLPETIGGETTDSEKGEE